MKNQSFSNERPEFNQAMLFVVSLDKLNGEIDTAYMEGQFHKVYRGLKNVLSRIKYKIKINPKKVMFEEKYSDKLNEIDKKFKAAKVLLSESQELVKANVGITEEKLNELREILFDFQWDLHMIFPKKSFMNFDDEIKGDFN